MKQRMAEDELLFGRLMLPNMFSLSSPEFHFELARAYHDRSNDKLNIIAPRGHAKSSLVACVFVLHHLFFDQGRKFVLLVSKTEGHAVRLLDTIKNALEYSQPLRLFFGYQGEHVARIWKQTELELPNGDYIMCRGTGQQVVGLKKGDQRPTLILLDDPEDMTNTKTAEAMEYNLRWLLQALLPARDAQRGRVIVIGTPQHERCMVETLKDMEGWKTLAYKSLYPKDPLHQDIPLTRENVNKLRALWDEQWSVEKLLAEKESLESINRVSSFYREYQCEIIGDEDQLFKEEYLQEYFGTAFRDRRGEWFLKLTHLYGNELPEPKLVPINIFTGIDPASSLAQTADYSVIMNVGIDAQDNRYILEYIRKRLSPMQLATAIMANHRKWRPKKTQIETVGYQEMLRDYLRQQGDIFIPGLEIKNNPRSSKSNRLETLEPWFRGLKVFLLAGMQELKDEALLYPRGKHDDLLDGLYYAFKSMFKPYHQWQEGTNNETATTRWQRFHHRHTSWTQA